MQDDWFECFQTNEMRTKIKNVMMKIIKNEFFCSIIVSFLQDDQGRTTLHDFIENKQIITTPDKQQIMLRYSRSQPDSLALMNMQKHVNLCVVQAKRKTLFLGQEEELWRMICKETNDLHQRHNEKLIELLQFSIINQIEYYTRITNSFIKKMF
jgi:hypothetical protein